MRVPTPNVSVVDLTAELKNTVTVEQVNETLAQAASSSLKGILDYTEKPLVSKDFNGNPHSPIVDGLSTMVMEGNMVKVIAWYDNEWGYSNRVVDLVAYVADKGSGQCPINGRYERNTVRVVTAEGRVVSRVCYNTC